MPLDRLCSKAVKAVLHEVDEHLGEYDTSSKQQEFLSTFVAENDLYYRPRGPGSKGAALKPHDENSIKRMLEGIARRELKQAVARPGQTELGHLLEQGSAALKADYLQRMEAAARGIDEGSEEIVEDNIQEQGLKQAQVAPPLAAGATAAIDDSLSTLTELASIGSQEKSKEYHLPPASNDAQRSASSLGQSEPDDTDVFVAESEAEDEPVTAASHRAKRRLASSTEVQTGVKFRPVKAPKMDQTEPESQTQIKDQRELNSTGSKSQIKTNDAVFAQQEQSQGPDRGPNESQNDDATQKPEAFPENSTEEANGPCQSSHATAPLLSGNGDISQLPRNEKEQSEHPPTANTADTASEKATTADSRFADAAYRPGGKARHITMMGSDEPIGILTVDLQSAANSIRNSINSAVAMLKSDGRGNEGYSVRSADVATLPAASLKDLYVQVFGGPRWPEMVFQLQSELRLREDVLLQSLISAFLVLKVFRQPPPWDSPLSCVSDPSMTSFQQFLGPVLKRKEVDFHRALHEATLIQIRNGDFQNSTVEPIATELAREMCITLNAHLALLQNRTNTHGWQARFTQRIRDVCKQALILHGKLEASQDKFNIVWPSSEANFDEEEMATTDGFGGALVNLTMFPGLRCTPMESESWPEFVAVRAVVDANQESG